MRMDDNKVKEVFEKFKEAFSELIQLEKITSDEVFKIRSELIEIKEELKTKKENE